jgi:hypothetical protein
MAERIDVRGVIATVIADHRASGDTGMVENLLEADARLAELFAAAKECKDTELGEMACIGSHAPCEHALGLLFATLARATGEA